MDIDSLDRGDDYAKAKEAMLLTTDTEYAQWTSIKSNDKKRARINAMRFFLNQFDYKDNNLEVVYPAEQLLVRRGRGAVD
jgi:polyphosphate kinase